MSETETENTEQEPQEPFKVGVIGARGYVGRELLGLIGKHPHLRLTFAASRADAGKPVTDMLDGKHGHIDPDLLFSPPTPESAAAAGLDVCVLALPNGLCAEYEAAFDEAAPDCLLIDLSADKRDPATAGDNWVYAIPELDRDKLAGAKRISNPGCYATAAQLALAPLKGKFADAPRVFGISGYSGAGTSPSRKNDPEVLRDNIIPYSLTGHIHEGEMTRRIGQDMDFMPHVASFFRGITVTVDMRLNEELTHDHVRALYEAMYEDEPLIGLSDAAPEIPGISGTPECRIGGWTLGAGGKRLVTIAVIDNLMKGAASQALQNINIALGMDELAGIVKAG